MSLVLATCLASSGCAFQFNHFSIPQFHQEELAEEALSLEGEEEVADATGSGGGGLNKRINNIVKKRDDSKIVYVYRSRAQIASTTWVGALLASAFNLHSAFDNCEHSAAP